MSVKSVKKGALEYLTSDLIAAPHCFTTRLGGVSKGYLESMNIGIHRGDDPENVIKNYRILCRELGCEAEDLVLSHQVHSDIVLAVDRENCGAGLFSDQLPECDALVTNTPGVGLVIFTADCTPIVLHDPVTGAVGAAHAGWRGTASGIAARTAEKMVKLYGCRPENIRASIGPNIGACCFETDADVPQALLSRVGPEVEQMIRQQGNKYYVNLKEINALHLRRCGVRTMDISTECTHCSPDRFWSHRITGGQRGSQGAIIVCRGTQR